jgi:hypothetical protein
LKKPQVFVTKYHLKLSEKLTAGIVMHRLLLKADTGVDALSRGTK